MLMLRKIAVFLLGSSLISFLLAMAVATAVITTFTGPHIKHWLISHNTYQNLMDSVLKENKTTNVGSGSSEVSFSQPEVQAAIKKTFTPEVLQKITEQFIDGTEPWLKGKVPKPTFQIDVSTIKANLVGNVVSFARERYNSLPVCVKGQVPSTTNPLSAECRLANVNVEATFKQLETDMLNNKDFLPDQLLTADNLKVKDEASGQSKLIFDQLRSVPKVYKWVQFSPYIFGVLSLFAGAAIILLSADKRRGLRRVAISLLTAGLFLIVLAWLGSYLFHKADQKISTANQNGEVIIQNSVLPIIRDIENALLHVMVVFGIVFLLVFTGLVIYLMITKKPPSKGDKPTDIPEPDTHNPEASSRPYDAPPIVSG